MALCLRKAKRLNWLLHMGVQKDLPWSFWVVVKSFEYDTVHVFHPELLGYGSVN